MAISPQQLTIYLYSASRGHLCDSTAPVVKLYRKILRLCHCLIRNSKFLFFAHIYVS